MNAANGNEKSKLRTHSNQNACVSLNNSHSESENSVC